MVRTAATPAPKTYAWNRARWRSADHAISGISHTNTSSWRYVRTRMKHHSDQNATLLIASKALQVACSRASPALRDRHSVALCLRHWLRRGVPLVSARSLHLHFRNVQPPVPTEPWYDVGGRRAATGAFRVGRGATVESVPPPPPPPPRTGFWPRGPPSPTTGGAATGGAATLGQPAG